MNQTAAAQHRRRTEEWSSRLRLIDPDSIEETIKNGALEVEHRGCSTPWWVWPTTTWRNIRRVERADMPYPDRCVAFYVTAGRHLAPREVSHPLFVATLSQFGRNIPNPPDGRGNEWQQSGTLGTNRIASASEKRMQRTRAAAQVCGQGDFITSRVIDGTDGGPTIQNKGTKGGGAGVGKAQAGFFSRLYRGGGSDDPDDDHPHALRTYGVVQNLPILRTDTLQRHIAQGMRPMIGLQGLPDEVTLETNVSRGNESVVTLRLDMSQPRQLGGYVAYTTARRGVELDPSKDFGVVGVGEDRHEFSRQQTRVGGVDESPQVAQMSLLLACVEGSVRAGDVIQYWTEVNRPDGVIGRTADEWVEYAQAVKEDRVPCEVLFTSLQHLLAKAQRAAAAALGSSTLAIDQGGEATLASVAALKRKGAFVSEDPGASSAGPAGSLVSLDTVEQQLRSIQREYRWTKDGIDVTGLRSDLQEALNRRRVTKSQLKEIEEARRRRLEQEAERAQASGSSRLSITSDGAGGSKNGSGGSGNGTDGPTASFAVSQKERLLEALKLYKAVAAAGGEHREVVAAIRIRLPRFDPFVVPYDLFLRTALHKDVVCGTNISAYEDLSSPRVAVPPPNPYSLVTTGRVEILDLPATVAPHPPTVKQCEVEGNMPLLMLNVTGARYAAETFTAGSVFLEEIPNPELPARFRKYQRERYYDSGEIGLKPCLPELSNGMEVVVARATKKHLYIQLNACPSFRMLAPEEYNEHQDSEELLQRLRYPRLLKVTVRGALKPDSFTTKDGATVSAANGAVFLGNGEGKSRAEAVLMTVAPQEERQAHKNGSGNGKPKTNLDVTFVVKVIPTLARLHLRGAPRAFAPEFGTALARSFKATGARPLVLCERDMRRNGFELGVELIGDYWTTPVGELRADGSRGPSTGADSEEDEEESTSGESAFRRAQAAAAEQSGSAPTHYSHTTPRDRAAANVALLNSFSIVEHYTLESSHHLFLKGAGVYRSHFVNYLFSNVLGDANVLRNHPFIRRFNDTFVSVAVPPQPLSAVRQGGSGNKAGGGYNYWWRGSAQQQLSSLWLEEVDLDALDDLMGGMNDEVTYKGGRADGNAAKDVRNRGVPLRSYYGGTPLSFQLPAVRRFSKIEEILFAVPGIATECRGCLLADTTFFVAGDLSGLWSFPGYYAAAAAGSPSKRKAAAAGDSGIHLATALPPLENSVLVRPLILPWYDAGVIPRTWQLHWMCPSAASAALTAFYHLWESVQTGYRDEVRYADRAPGTAVPTLGEATLHMEAVLYTMLDTAGSEIPVSQRPITLLASDSIPLPRVLASFSGSNIGSFTSQAGFADGGDKRNGGQTLTFRVKSEAVDAAYTTVAADYLRYRRPGGVRAALGPSPAFRYHRDDRNAGGLMVVNASVFVKLCVPLPRVVPGEEKKPLREESGQPRQSCMVVSVTDSLIVVEPPRPPRTPSALLAFLRAIFGIPRSSPEDKHRPTLWASLLTREGRSALLSPPALLHHLFLALLFYLVLPLLSSDAARNEDARRGRHGGGGSGSRGDYDDSRVPGFLTLSRLLIDSRSVVADDVDMASEAAANEARVAFTILFFVFVVFSYAYLPLVWLGTAFLLWAYVLYKARDGFVLLLFIGYVLYWRLFL